MGTLLKVLFFPFKLLAWLITFPVRIATGPLKFLVVILLLALIIAGVQIVLFQQFFGD